MSKIKLMLPLVWSMPNKWTFQMPVVKELIEKYWKEGQCWNVLIKDSRFFDVLSSGGLVLVREKVRLYALSSCHSQRFK